MENIKRQLKLVLFALCIIGSACSADYPEIVEITADKDIQVGEPLILRLAYKFKVSQISDEGNEIYNSIGAESTIYIKTTGKEEIVEQIFGDLYPQDKAGLTYCGNFTIFYDSFRKKLIFNSPGIYTITVSRTNTIISNPLEITVEPASSLSKEMLAILSNPDDFTFIERGSKEYFEKRPDRISIIKKFVEEYKNTILAQMAAAQLGLIYFEQFMTKHPSLTDFKSKYQQGKVEEQFFEMAYKYLSIGSKISPEFPIREHVLHQLIGAEFIKNDYEKATSLADDLTSNYPHGRYGRYADRAKEELQTLKKQELEQIQKTQQKKPLGFVLLVTAAAVVGLFIIGGILLFKKKAKTKGQ